MTPDELAEVFMTPDELAKHLRNHEKPMAWFNDAHAYAPFLFHIMTAHERQTLADWYDASIDDWPNGQGASGFATISTISGFILGSGISNLVQCGHYIGFSSMIIGSVFRYMGRKNALYSMDIHPKAHAYAAEWVDRAGLSDYVKLVPLSSDSPDNVVAAQKYFGNKIQSVFIDSSHAYGHTMKELALWGDALRPSGIVFLHDVSQWAKTFDSTDKGGVKAAALEFLEASPFNGVLLNSTPTGNLPVYTDPCGLGILQKQGKLG